MTTSPPKSPKCETPFGCVPFAWNYIPQCGIPTRERASSIVTEDERKAGIKLVADYRAQEVVALEHDLEGYQHSLDELRSGNGVEKARLRAAMAKADHGVYLAAHAKMAELRQQAIQIMTPIIKRLVQSLNDELNTSALEAEQRLAKAGFPTQRGDSWLLHGDVICEALWSCRHKAEKALSELTPDNAIGAVQYFLTPEEHTPFNWP